MKKRSTLLFIFSILAGVGFLGMGNTMNTGVAYAQADPTCEATVVVQPGDTLSGLANSYLGSFGAYQSIVDATNTAAVSDSGYALIENASLIRVGWQLCIPRTLTSGSTVAASASSSPETAASQSATSEPVAPSSAGQATPALVAVPTPPSLDQFDELHPLMIESMRQRSYPGSELIIEQTLNPGASYSRHVASYLSDGHKIFGLLTIPDGTMPENGWPLILFNHGYIPPEVYRTTERYVAYQNAFASNGYISFKSDYRGHGSSEGAIDPDGPNSGNRHAAYTADVLNALASLKQRSDVDADRIGLWGHSMGGQITLRAMVISGDIKAGSIWAGTVANYTTMWDRWQERSRNNPEWANRTRRWREQLVDQYGQPDENPDFWASISPNSYLTDLSGPILLQHATGDATVPVAYSDALDAEINAVDGSVEYFRYEGDDHNLSANLGVALARDIAFFDAHLK